MFQRGMRPICLYVLIIPAVLFPGGCDDSGSTGKAVDNTSKAFALPGVLVSVDWLHKHASDDHLVVVDARRPEEYAAGHIAGAVNIPTGVLLDPDPANSKNMAPVSLIQTVLSEAGIDMGQTVVVYDGDKYREAARVFWVLEVHGLPSVAVLDGGLSAWKRRELATSTTPARPMRRRFFPNMQRERLATKLTVARAMTDPGTVILDSRSSDEFHGVLSKASRAGHIMSAVNIDFARNLAFDEEGVCGLRFSDDLLTLYETELKNHKKVITYCNSGNRASVSYLALRVIGYNAAVYDGSWLEWGNDPELPIE